MSGIGSTPFDSSGKVINDLPCVSCGYNLHGLTAESVCPECGITVRRSQYGSLLRFSHPTWVRQLSSGTKLIAAAIGIGILLLCLLFVHPAGNAWFIMSILSLVPHSLLLGGILNLTASDPSVAETGLTTRRVVRIAAIGNFIAALVRFSGPIAAQRAVSITCTLLTLAASVVLLLALSRYLSRLALRVPDSDLARHTRIVILGFLISMVLTAVSFRWILLMEGLSSNDAGIAGFGATVGVSISLISGLVMFCLAILGLLLIIRYQRALDRAAQMALLTWASEPQGSADAL